jgi:hypothetical protein
MVNVIGAFGDNPNAPKDSLHSYTIYTQRVLCRQFSKCLSSYLCESDVV